MGARIVDDAQSDPAERPGSATSPSGPDGPRKQTMHERHRITEEFRRDCARENGELCLNRDHELGVAAAARIENLTGRSFGADGHHR